MRVLVLSDIHANLAALEAVLEAAGEFDAAWCLGDIVGYGPSPNECVDLIRELPNLICLQGNHDAAATGELPLDSFNYEARSSIEWLHKNLNAESNSFLKSLGQRSAWGKYTLVHASPRKPLLEYLLDTQAAFENFGHFETAYCFVGHTHIPTLFHLPATGQTVRLLTQPASDPISLEARSIVNPGSVGQPRDHDPRASFAMLDSEESVWKFQRVQYDIRSVQKLMQAAHLPDRNITRLESGW